MHRGQHSALQRSADRAAQIVGSAGDGDPFRHGRTVTRQQCRQPVDEHSILPRCRDEQAVGGDIRQQAVGKADPRRQHPHPPLVHEADETVAKVQDILQAGRHPAAAAMVAGEEEAAGLQERHVVGTAQKRTFHRTQMAQVVTGEGEALDHRVAGPAPVDRQHGTASVRLHPQVHAMRPESTVRMKAGAQLNGFGPLPGECRQREQEQPSAGLLRNRPPVVSGKDRPPESLIHHQVLDAEHRPATRRDRHRPTIRESQFLQSHKHHQPDH
ncbi:hypothetical protein TSH7_25620 [Azospirillum sp. TSH7]|nr:hypothetical protein TSH7_25620 [Azospirillum sp. TSH7]